MSETNFLAEKYSNLPGSHPVNRAVFSARRKGVAVPDTKHDRIGAYLHRLEGIMENERGFALLKAQVLDRFTINTQNEELLTTISKGLYESEKRLATEQGCGGDAQRLESEHDVVELYKPLIMEKAQIQRKTLTSWFDYLQQNDVKYPMWFRYYIVRSLGKMGTLDKEKGTYSTRTPTTVAPFPELNSEALGWVYEKLEATANQKNRVPEENKQLETLIKAKDFPKLYAFAQIETAGNLNRESIEGQWRRYNKASDYHVLEGDLKGKGTGWCTAESAQGQLQGGDFYVYYSKGADGRYTEPRVAIRMESDHVAEVRGVNPRQELEPGLLNIAQTQYHQLPGGEAFDKKTNDMRRITTLTKIQVDGQQFTKEDLIFLYEINGTIEGFGYEKDPRIAQLRKQRIPEEDMSIIFSCRRGQIARSMGKIRHDTKAYVGKLTPGIFNVLPQQIEHIYVSFPEGRIRKESLLIGGKTAKQLEASLTGQGIRISGDVQDMLRNKDFQPQKIPEDITIVRLKVGDLGFTDNPSTYELYCCAKTFGLELCSAETGPHMRLVDTDQPSGKWYYIAMKQITDSGGDPIFRLARDGGGLGLDISWVDQRSHWRLDDVFVFRLRKQFKPFFLRFLRA